MQDDVVCGEDEKKRREEDGAGGRERERWFNQSALGRLELRQQVRPLRHEPWERAATGPAASLSHSQDNDGGQSHRCAQYGRRGTWPQRSALTGDCLAGCDSAWRLLRLGGLIGVGEGSTMMLLRKHLGIRGWEAESGKAGDKSKWSCDSNSNPVRAVIVPGAKSAPCGGVLRTEWAYCVPHRVPAPRVFSPCCQLLQMSLPRWNSRVRIRVDGC